MSTRTFFNSKYGELNFAKKKKKKARTQDSVIHRSLIGKLILGEYYQELRE